VGVCVKLIGFNEPHIIALTTNAQKQPGEDLLGAGADVFLMET
jgi:hypothetical protein